MNLTRDTLLGGELVLWQPAKGEGYRFNLDPVFLASFCGVNETVVELGAGCGVLGLFLLKTGRAGHVIAVEREPEMAELIERNATENGLSDRVDVMVGDLRELSLPAAGAVVFNPPYFPANQGRPAKNRLRDNARFERHGTLADFVSAAARLVGEGEVAAIVPVGRVAELEALLSDAGLETTRRRLVKPRAVDDALLAMVAASHNRAGSGTLDEPSLVIHEGHEGREFTREVRDLIDGAGAE